LFEQYFARQWGIFFGHYTTVTAGGLLLDRTMNV
jgi:hypothetical protein